MRVTRASAAVLVAASRRATCVSFIDVLPGVRLVRHHIPAGPRKAPGWRQESFAMSFPFVPAKAGTQGHKRVNARLQRAMHSNVSKSGSPRPRGRTEIVAS